MLDREACTYVTSTSREVNRTVLYRSPLLVYIYLHCALPRRKALQVIDRESRPRSETNGIVEENNYRDSMLILRIRDTGTAYRLPKSCLWTCRRSHEYTVRYTVLHRVHDLIVE